MRVLISVNRNGKSQSQIDYEISELTSKVMYLFKDAEPVVITDKNRMDRDELIKTCSYAIFGISYDESIDSRIEHNICVLNEIKIIESVPIKKKKEDDPWLH